MNFYFNDNFFGTIKLLVPNLHTTTSMVVCLNISKKKQMRIENAIINYAVSSGYLLLLAPVHNFR